MEAADAINKSTAKELTTANQHASALWLYNKHKHLDQHGVLPAQCRIRFMTISSRLRRGGSAKRYEQNTHGDWESDEDGQYPGQVEHAVHITCNKDNLSPTRTTRSVTRIRSRKYPEPAVVAA